MGLDRGLTNRCFQWVTRCCLPLRPLFKTTLPICCLQASKPWAQTGFSMKCEMLKPGKKDPDFQLIVVKLDD